MVVNIGILPKFDLSRGPFKVFEERIQFLLSANRVAEGKYAAVILLSTVGEETNALLRKLLAPSLPKKSFAEIVKML